MSDQSNVEPSNESASKSLDENIDKDRNRTSQPSEGTPAKKVPGLGADSTSATTTKDTTENAHHGVFASPHNAIRSATETIKHFLRESCFVYTGY